MRKKYSTRYFSCMEIQEESSKEMTDDEREVNKDPSWLCVVDSSSDSSSSESSFSSPLTNPSSYECSRKRKNVISSNVPNKKRRPATKRVFSDPHDTVNKSSSNLSEGEVKRLFKIANISSTDYEFLVPSKDQRANKPPEGYITVYSIQIDAGLRFPLHDLVEKVCNLIKVSPSQLVPNAHRMIVGFIFCAQLYDIPPTADSFFSLFYVSKVGVPDNGFFHFVPRRNWSFLCDRPRAHPSWKEEFFFLRQKGKSWNCITIWRERYSTTRFDPALAKLAINKGILDHCFRFNELTSKEILVHGGIEPGIPSPKVTFRYLMHNAAVDKFELLPEDESHASKITRKAKIPSTSKFGASFPDQPSAKQPVNHEQPSSSPSPKKMAYSTVMPISKNSSAFSEDSIPLSVSLCKTKEGKATKSTLLTCPDLLPPHLLTICQTIDSAYVPRDRYLKLEKKSQELTSVIASTRSRVQELELQLELSKVAKSRVKELEQALELSEAKRAKYENLTSWAMETVKYLKKSVENLKSDSNRFCDKIIKEASATSSQMLSRKK